ncbi:unnamed protein product [Schistocephalus solidus]|uniref:Uncharacterized protein n=1 Tax=Schistocephalus solidus TaxID=70667 RepID=A0A183SK04_SCHSO|nr:unnamed protein product [Schistocephalus solidus]
MICFHDETVKLHPSFKVYSFWNPSSPFYVLDFFDSLFPLSPLQAFAEANPVCVYGPKYRPCHLRDSNSPPLSMRNFFYHHQQPQLDRRPAWSHSRLSFPDVFYGCVFVSASAAAV